MSNPLDKQRYLTIDEFVQRLQDLGLTFTDRTVRNWIKTKKIRAIRPGARAWYIPVEEIGRLLERDSEVFALRLAAA